VAAVRNQARWSHPQGIAVLQAIGVIAEIGRSVRTGVRNRLVRQAYAELRRRQGRAFRSAEAHGLREWILEYFHL
jgi:hypothetical protein